MSEEELEQCRNGSPPLELIQALKEGGYKIIHRCGTERGLFAFDEPNVKNLGSLDRFVLLHQAIWESAPDDPDWRREKDEDF